jgi:hypothetical protein
MGSFIEHHSSRNPSETASIILPQKNPSSSLGASCAEMVQPYVLTDSQELFIGLGAFCPPDK